MGKSTSHKIGKTHLIIPDCQVKPGINTDHLKHISNYIVEKRPEVIINIGDFNDLASLSSYSVGKAEAEGKRYNDDIRCGKDAMAKLVSSIRKYNQGRKVKYEPDMHLTLGNHENRILRVAESDPKMIGTISTKDLGYEEFGFKVHPFLKIVRIDGIQYSHYFCSGVLGRPVSSAAALLRTRQGSATMGHVQRIDIAIHPQTQQTALFSGICYSHFEEYLGNQGNDTKAGIWLKHEIDGQGGYDLNFVSLKFLARNYS
jgi:hypothetical protein